MEDIEKLWSRIETQIHAKVDHIQIRHAKNGSRKTVTESNPHEEQDPDPNFKIKLVPDPTLKIYRTEIRSSRKTGLWLLFLKSNI